MIRATAPTITATLSTGLVLDVKSADLNLDESRAPYTAASIAIAQPDTAAALATIDSRQGRRVAVVVNDRADLFGNPATSRAFDLVLRDRQWGVAGAELVLSCYSDEQLLIDTVLLAANVKDWGLTSARALVNAVLATFGVALAPGGADMAIAATAAVQSPGQSYWDFLDGTLQGGNLRLWCDEQRVWRLDDKGTIAPGLTALGWGETVTGINDSIGLDENFYDALVVRYSYLDASGNAQTSYDHASAPNPKRGTRLDFDSAPAAPGGARRLLRRMMGRGRVLTNDVVNRFDVTPTQSFITRLPAGAPAQSGLVSGVTWRLPADRMDVRTRQLADTLGTAWGGQAAGVTWASIPAGVPWSKYLAIPWTTPATAKAWSAIPAGYRWSEFDKYLKENN